jgi:Phosphatidylethanolamine-binding protein
MRSLLLFEQGRTPTSKMARPAVLFRLRVKDGLAEYIEVRQVRPSNRTDEVIHLNAYVRSWWLVQTGQVGGLLRAYLRVATVTAVLTTIAAVDVTCSVAIAMSLSFSWTGVARCSSSPPAFTLSDVPPGTSRLAFNMVDLNVPSYPHGGGTISYQGGNQIAAGSFSYKGPCPPEHQRHNYRWTVKALDAGGKTLATTSAASPFPPR